MLTNLLLTDLVKALDMYKMCHMAQGELRKEKQQLTLVYYSKDDMPAVRELIKTGLVSPHAIELVRAQAAQAQQYVCAPAGLDSEGRDVFRVTRALTGSGAARAHARANCATGGTDAAGGAGVAHPARAAGAAGLSGMASAAATAADAAHSAAEAAVAAAAAAAAVGALSLIHI